MYGVPGNDHSSTSYLRAFHHAHLPVLSLEAQRRIATDVSRRDNGLQSNLVGVSADSCLWDQGPFGSQYHW